MTCTPLAAQAPVHSGRSPSPGQAASRTSAPSRCSLASSTVTRGYTELTGRTTFTRISPVSSGLVRRIGVSRSSGALRSTGSLVFSEAPVGLSGDSVGSRCPSESPDCDENDAQSSRPSCSSGLRPTTRRQAAVADPRKPTSEPEVDASPDEQSGLTAASLKHLRRQRDALAEERGRLLEEIERLKALLKAQSDGNNLETTAQLSALIREKHAALAAAKNESEITGDLKKQLDKATEAVLLREIEIAQLQTSLTDQQSSTHRDFTVPEVASDEVHAAKAAALSRVTQLEGELAVSEASVIDLEMKVKSLRQDTRELQKDCRAQELEKAKLAEMNRCHQQRRDDDRARVSDIVACALNSNIVLNICLPHAVLKFNDAPPVVIGAEWLSKEKLHAFVNDKVSPAFDTLWARFDGSDNAPDGTSQQKYKDRSLDLLTDAVDKYVNKFLVKSRKDWEDKFNTDSCS